RFHTTKPGPMLGTLRNRVDDAIAGTYDMAFAWHQLEAPRDEQRLQRIWDLMPEVHDAGFPSDLAMLAFWVLGRFFRERIGTSKLYCGELVAMTYQAAGWMDTSLIPNRFDPRDFSDTGRAPLLDGARLTVQQEFAPPAHP